MRIVKTIVKLIFLWWFSLLIFLPIADMFITMWNQTGSHTITNPSEEEIDIMGEAFDVQMPDSVEDFTATLDRAWQDSMLEATFVINSNDYDELSKQAYASKTLTAGYGEIRFSEQGDKYLVYFRIVDGFGGLADIFFDDIEPLLERFKIVTIVVTVIISFLIVFWGYWKWKHPDWKLSAYLIKQIDEKFSSDANE